MESGDLYIGVDTGGTFTDVVVMDAAGNVVVDKAPTTPHALEEGVFGALALVAELQSLPLEELLGRAVAFGHGTTQATNALIERTGARTGLLTTRGFADTLAVQRLLGFTAGMSDDELGWYSHRSYPEAIVHRSLVREIPERVDQAGTVVTALDEAATRTAIASLIEEGVDALAICLLWSFRNDAHERRVAEIAREIAGDELFVSISSEICPVIGEYERTATTVLNSYLGPVVARYLERLDESLRERGFRGTFSVLNSTGGVMSAREAARRAVLLLASGPTGGVIGSRYLADALGHENVITSDMGGTSFDVGVILGGQSVVAGVSEVARYHLAVPMVDIRAVGAGGGSIASVADGLIRVGPESAGAYPGPVSYGRGGTRPTVTDANLVLGIIDPDVFLGGRMRLDRDAAAAAIAEHVADPLGLSVEEAAAGIRRIVDSHMADTLRELTVGRGHDPRDFVLYAYGGAGPMHCAAYGAELGVSRIVVPRTSMAQSAYGALASDIHHSAERTRIVRGGGGSLPGWDGIDPEVVRAQFEGLADECLAAVVASGVAPEEVRFTRSVDMRYRRQTHELIIPFAGEGCDEAAIRDLVERFERTYEDTYGRGAGFREAGIELTTFRVDAAGQTRKPRFAEVAAGAAGDGRPGDAGARTRRIYDGTSRAWIDVAVRDWEQLAADEVLPGPAVLEHPTTTVVVAAGQAVSVDRYGNLIIEPERVA